MLRALVIGLIGYLFAIIGVIFHSLIALAIYRILVGITAGSGSILGAIVADISPKEKKSRNFGLLSMCYGSGFIIAPFVGGFLVKQYGYLYPFLVPFALVMLNIAFVAWKLPETLAAVREGKVSIFKSFALVKQASHFPTLRTLFISLLVFTFGWSFFTEFTPLFLNQRFHFAPGSTGIYYGYAGLFYALCAGFVVFPVVKRLGAARTLYCAQIGSGLAILGMLFISSPLVLWLYIPVTQLFMAFVFPTTSTVISDTVGDDRQGEAMGIYQSISALGLALSPLFSGSLVGMYPALVVILGGGLMAVGGLMFGLFHQRPQADDSAAEVQ